MFRGINYVLFTVMRLCQHLKLLFIYTNCLHNSSYVCMTYYLQYKYWYCWQQWH